MGKNEMTPIPLGQVTLGFWWASADADALGLWPVTLTCHDAKNGMEFFAPIPSVELCRWLHDNGIATVAQLEGLRNGEE